MITIKVNGDHKKTYEYLKKMSRSKHMELLRNYGQRGVDALASATPVDSRLTARSWVYEITKSKGVYSIVWSNTNVNDGINIAVIIQYGHATKGGGWVQGRDYINPSIQPIFDEITNEIWRQVTNG